MGIEMCLPSIVAETRNSGAALIRVNGSTQRRAKVITQNDRHMSLLTHMTWLYLSYLLNTY